MGTEMTNGSGQQTNFINTSSQRPLLITLIQFPLGLGFITSVEPTHPKIWVCPPPRPLPKVNVTINITFET